MATRPTAPSDYAPSKHSDTNNALCYSYGGAAHRTQSAGGRAPHHCPRRGDHRVPARYRRDLLITLEGADASHRLVDHISTLNASAQGALLHRLGAGARERTAIDLVPASACAAVLDPDGAPRDLEEAGPLEGQPPRTRGLPYNSRE